MLVKVITSGRVMTALVMFLIFLTMTALALRFTEKAALMPLMIGVPGTLLGLVQLIMEFRKASAELAVLEQDPAKIEEKRQERRSELEMIIWMLLFFASILCFGFIYAAPVVVFAFLYFGKNEGLVTGIISAISTWVVLYWFFQQWFEIPLFRGLVIEWLIG